MSVNSYEDLAADDPGGTVDSALVTLKSMKTISDNASVTEAMVLSGLGRTAGNALLAKLEDQLSAAEVRVLRNDGINMADVESQVAVSSMQAGGIITLSEHDWLIGQAATLKYPDIRMGDIEEARRLWP